MFFVLQTQLLEPVLIFFWGGGTQRGTDVDSRFILSTLYGFDQNAALRNGKSDYTLQKRSHKNNTTSY